MGEEFVKELKVKNKFYPEKHTPQIYCALGRTKPAIRSRGNLKRRIFFVRSEQMRKSCVNNCSSTVLHFIVWSTAVIYDGLISDITLSCQQAQNENA